MPKILPIIGSDPNVLSFNRELVRIQQALENKVGPPPRNLTKQRRLFLAYKDGKSIDMDIMQRRLLALARHLEGGAITTDFKLVVNPETQSFDSLAVMVDLRLVMDHDRVKNIIVVVPGNTRPPMLIRRDFNAIIRPFVSLVLQALDAKPQYESVFSHACLGELMSLEIRTNSGYEPYVHATNQPFVVIEPGKSMGTRGPVVAFMRAQVHLHDRTRDFSNGTNICNTWRSAYVCGTYCSNGQHTIGSYATTLPLDQLNRVWEHFMSAMKIVADTPKPLDIFNPEEAGPLLPAPRSHQCASSSPCTSRKYGNFLESRRTEAGYSRPPPTHQPAPPESLAGHAAPAPGLLPNPQGISGIGHMTGPFMPPTPWISHFMHNPFGDAMQEAARQMKERENRKRTGDDIDSPKEEDQHRATGSKTFFYGQN